MKKYLPVMLLCIVSLSWPGVRRTTQYYEITLPDGWMQISRETTQFLTAEMNQESLLPANRDFDFLYQPKSKAALFSFPCVLIQVNGSGRLTEKELASYDSRLFRYDPASHSLWGFRDSVVEVIIATEEGTINLFCYAPLGDMGRYREEFITIAKSVVVLPEWRYEANILRDLPVVRELLYGTISYSRVLILLVIVVLVGQKLRKKKTAEN